MLPWRRTCQDAREEESCPTTIKARRQARETNNEDPNEFDNMNYFRENDFVCNVEGKPYAVFEDHESNKA